MKITDNLDITIKDYIGNMEGGVTSVLAIIYDDKFYEGIYWYTNEVQVITFPEELEAEMGGKIENFEHFNKIQKHLRDSEAKYETIINNLDSAI